ncbi:coproporphyrinogen dehydrogenase HemZ [uncultured Subdoligranulum sp.]|uniref:coproporphyrinogen dehydrogenase HemZ n=1 Tax=uncultured Subdoligranulum sp. TaxID=512298 RepID=UPI00263800EF|nr:coproporphyrinogen dehydrogenase HemZ [uncultured Subdoligranulum sp.]
MQIVLRGTAAGYEAEHTARLFFPGAEKAVQLPESGDYVLAVSHEKTDFVLLRLGQELCWRTALRGPEADAEYTLCCLMYDLLREKTGQKPPWGMMTGVRPVRIIHDLRAMGAAEAEVEDRFLRHFACTPEKFALARGIADLQRPVLEAADPMDCSVYAGIPFCPTRCSYCSFVSRTVGDKATRALVQPYVDKLCEELTAIRQTADRCGLRIRTFYIGGGTPTSLTAAQLEQLMSHIARTFDLSALDEYTVEAGRPDCTDLEKLRIIKQYGATRISINPQTFSDEVLRNIGRRHTAQDIIDCFAAARSAGHDNINMDLIAGLPGDTVEGFAHSLEQAIALDPENITVHTLTLKRASNLVVEHRAADYDDVAAMLDRCNLLQQAGYRPYYLYRQKGTLQNLENTGWAKPGKECLYNIYIMEEVHTILSAGAGGSTKLVIPGKRHGKIERIFNFKYPTEYIDRFGEILARKQGVEDFYERYATQTLRQP